MISSWRHGVTKYFVRAANRNIRGQLIDRLLGSTVGKGKDSESVARQNKTPTASSMNKTREALEKDVEAFLASGNEIEQIPAGVTGQDSFKGSKHIVISRRPKQVTKS